MRKKSKPKTPRGTSEDLNARSITRNRRASYDYEIIKRYEAGLALTGTEIKSLRAGKASIAEAYVRPLQGELWLIGANISRYEAAGRDSHDPARDRKLLVHRREIREVAAAVEERGLTLVPIHLFLRRGLAKLEFGLGRGRRQYDKRQAIARREAERKMREGMRR